MAACLSISALAVEKDSLPSAYSSLSVDGTYGYRKIVSVIRDPLSNLDNFVFECVSDSTENASHLFYELVIPGVWDRRYSISTGFAFVKSGVNIHKGRGYVDIFLGFTKEQAMDFFEELDDIKETRPLNLSRTFKGDYSEKIYRFMGQNRELAPADEDKDDVYIRYVKTENQGKAIISKAAKFFLFRSRYADKAYIEGDTVESYVKAIEGYQGEAENKAPCVSLDKSNIVDFSGVCNYERIGTRVLEMGTELDDFQIYAADKPQYEDERFHVVTWDWNTCDVFPIGKNAEDANANIDALEEAIDYAYKNQMGWYKKKQILKHELHDRDDERFPDYETTIRGVDYVVEGFTRVKSARFSCSRFGFEPVVFNRATLERVRKEVNRYSDSH